jgi:hypothetical protein
MVGVNKHGVLVFGVVMKKLEELVELVHLLLIYSLDLSHQVLQVLQQ